MATAILYHSNGDFLNAWTQQSFSIEPLIGEAEASLLPISRATELNLSNLVLQGDLVAVIDSLLSFQLAGLSSGPGLPWKISSIIHIAQSLILQLSLFSLSKISRACNLEAHSLAA